MVRDLGSKWKRICGVILIYLLHLFDLAEHVESGLVDWRILVNLNFHLAAHCGQICNLQLAV